MTIHQTRRPRRLEIRHQVLDRLLHATLPPGSRINESELATELGVSRTPLREALFRLEQEGFVRAEMDRGFMVVPLTAREVREIYPILWTLECLALRNTGRATAKHLADLSRINQELAAALAQPDLALDSDTRWHQVLLQPCPNQRLLAMIRSCKQVAYRYEWAYMRDSTLVATSVEQHERIIEALRADNLDRAVEGLQANWRCGMESLLSHLDWV